MPRRDRRARRRGRSTGVPTTAVVLVLAAVFVLGGARCATSAAPDGDGTTNDWQFRAALYTWLTAQQGTVTQGGRTVHVDVTMSDVFDLLGDGDALGGAGYFDVFNRPTRLGGYVNAVGSVVDTSAKKNRSVFGLDSSLAFVEWGVTYRLWQAWWGEDTDDPRTMWLEALVGGRYTYMSNTITVSRTQSDFERDVSSTAGFTDPIVGGRWLADLPYGFGLAFRGDIGGFGAGSQLSWSLASTLTYDLPWTLGGGPLALGAGYRIISFDYEDGSGESRQDIELEFKGPTLGVLANF
jgi:hypothetical protein